MNLQEILDLANLRLNQLQRTGRITVNTYNNVLLRVNTSLLNVMLRRMEANQEIVDDLFPFVKTVGSAGTEAFELDSNGRAPLPEDFVRFVVSGKNEFKASTCGVANEIEYKTITYYPTSKFYDRKSNALTKKYLPERPIMTNENKEIVVYPVVPRILFSYIRRPLTPFYDYQLLNGNYFYLPPGAVHDGSVPGIPAGTPSRSVELEWFEEVHPQFVDYVVKEFAIETESMLPLQTLDNQKQ